MTAARDEDDTLPDAETLLIPSRVHDPALGRPCNLAATFYCPPGEPKRGGWPLVVFSHGSTAGPGRIPRRQMLRYPLQARYFLDRGFAFLVPMRRGRGESEGDYVEGYAWDRLKFAEGFSHALDDLAAVIAHMRRQPQINGRRIVVAGQSRGGLLSIAYAGQHPQGIAGGISFAGGWIGDPGGTIVDPGAAGDFIRDVCMRAGAGAATPSLWLYASDDLYPPASVRRWHDAYTAAGGEAQLYIFPPVADGGRQRLLDRPVLWQSAVDAYLRQQGFFW